MRRTILFLNWREKNKQWKQTKLTTEITTVLIDPTPANILTFLSRKLSLYWKGKWKLCSLIGSQVVHMVRYTFFLPFLKTYYGNGTIVMSPSHNNGVMRWHTSWRNMLLLCGSSQSRQHSIEMAIYSVCISWMPCFVSILMGEDGIGDIRNGVVRRFQRGKGTKDRLKAFIVIRSDLFFPCYSGLWFTALCEQKHSDQTNQSNLPAWRLHTLTALRSSELQK